MSRLIDADDIKIDVTNSLSDCISIGKNTFDVVEVQEFIFNIIRNIPTAYDIEEVVEKLEEEKCTRVTYKDKYGQGWNNGTANAIDIVKRGGVE